MFTLEVTRNYGETASHKVSELLMHLIGAIIAVTIVVMLAMGWRGGLVVFLIGTYYIRINFVELLPTRLHA